MKNPETMRNWTEEESTEFYENLLKQVLEIIPDEGASMLLGPMFILRQPEENFALFNENRKKLEQQGIEIFDQLPFLDYNLKDAPFKYDLKFEIFYKKLIQSGKIKSCYLLPDWKKSEGTITEVRYCEENNVPVMEI